jgi:hypothetical protein
VNLECPSDTGQRLTRYVSANGVANLVAGHLVAIDSSLDATVFEVRGNSPAMNASLGREARK